MTVRERAAPPPGQLQDASKGPWRSVLCEYELEPHHMAILTAARESKDRMDEARQAVIGRRQADLRA
jgi:hypothetical protein